MSFERSTVWLLVLTLFLATGCSDDGTTGSDDPVSDTGEASDTGGTSDTGATADTGATNDTDTGATSDTGGTSDGGSDTGVVCQEDQILCGDTCVDDLGFEQPCREPLHARGAQAPAMLTGDERVERNQPDRPVLDRVLQLRVVRRVRDSG